MPPRHTRRAAKRKSYAEISSDEDSMGSSEDYSSDHEALSPVIRKRSGRLARSPAPAESSESQRPSRKAGRRNAHISYKENSTDEEGFDEPEVSEGEVPAPKRRRIVPQRSKATAAALPQRKLQYPVQKPNLAPQPKSLPLQAQVTVPSVRRPPFWETLPFHVWVQIFEYASYPLNDPTSFERYDTKKWLFGALTLCKELLDSALTVLYRSPNFSSYIDTVHSLSDLLATPLDSRPSASILGREINHNAKIQRLEIDVEQLAYSAHRRGRFDIGSLIPLVPQVNTIRLSNKYDTPMGRKYRRMVKWHYPDSLFTALGASKILLKSFQWNQSMCTKEQDLAWVKSIHETKSFQSLRELKLAGFADTERKRKDPEGPQEKSKEELLAEVISALPELKKIEFESCASLNEVLLPLLPQTLEVLHINDCGLFDGAMLASFLATHGSELKELILEHNKALDLSFLTALKSACPKLEVLKVDLNNYNSHRTYVDSKPTYIDLLREEEIATWPSTLREIEMLYLREWTDSAAVTFFRSIVNAAEELPELRVLRLKAILGLGWKQRIQFREEWVNRMHRIFLRPQIPPNLHFTSVAKGQAYLDRLRTAAGKEDGAEQGRSHTTAEISQQNVIDVDAKSDPESDDSNAVVTKSQKRKRSLPTPPSDSQGQRTLRPRRGHRAYGELSSPEPEPAQKPTSSLAAAARAILENYVQGMCDVVDVTIDNLRPAEKQFREGDFLDSEPSDDEEWDPREEGEYFEGWQT
ncbi:hypothetical protein NA57DRAFT_77678 [Rhizodiscina lignyota]|uniref:Uncharacterized protein n=1 Tax=Rhizodiscina lignyota TaxID=1504668 RepID=A0A9P4M531_9PEZI|nr:hypothetical protein NA57DRAFT_77678 [Rhizodiscina lignyota]